MSTRTLTINGLSFTVTGVQESLATIPTGELYGPVTALADSVSAINSNTSAGPFTVATVPPAALFTGRLIWVTNGNAGSPTPAVSDGTHWNVIAMGSPVATS